MTRQGSCIQIKIKPEDYEQLRNIADIHDMTLVRLVRLSIRTFLKLYKEDGFKDSLIAGTLRLKPSTDNSFGTNEQEFIKSILGLATPET